jgi:uncharacterized protein (TIGR03067 family)
MPRLRELKMKTDLERLQGTWNIVALEMDGQKMPSEGASIAIKGKRFTTTAMGATYNGMVDVDESKSPKTFDLKFTAGPEKGNTSLGIYELDKDTWKICLTLTGKKRPQKFATAPGSGFALETLQRDTSASSKRKGQKAGAPKRAASTKAVQAPRNLGDAQPVPELEGEWVMVSCVMAGQPLDEGYLKFGKRVARGNEVTVFMAGQVILKARFTADRAKEPKTMDYVLLHGPSNGKMQYSIYALKGKTLKVCSSAPGQARPADFSSIKGDGRTLTVWKLVKK